VFGWACAAVLVVSGAALAAEPPNTAPSGAKRFAVGETEIRFTDPSRLVRFPNRRPAPRSLDVVIRYPALGDTSGVDVRQAPPATADGPFPLVVFGHGFDATPATYSRLLQAWAAAGYVVAAPIFPLTNARTPGGANESDLVNQPTDMSFVISRMLDTSGAEDELLSGLIRPDEIAVAGQSDGGSTALAAAYNTHYVDHRILAAVILSGAKIPGVHGYDFRDPGPALLAAQGTADRTNLPASTYSYFRLAHGQRFLLSLLGASHRAPYTSEQPQLGIVERETVAFLDYYVKRLAGAGSRMWKAGRVAGVAKLTM
jgi:predicted dienelactone hydrolase